MSIIGFAMCNCAKKLHWKDQYSEGQQTNREECIELIDQHRERKGKSIIGSICVLVLVYKY